MRHFKPLVSEEDLREAEADIEAVIREVSAPQPMSTPHPSSAPAALAMGSKAEAQVPLIGGIPDSTVRDFLWRARTPTRAARIASALGMRGGIRRADTVNKIGRTVETGCAAGLARRPKAFDTAVGIYTKACDPNVGLYELHEMLGWVQATVAMACPSLTASRIREA